MYPEYTFTLLFHCESFVLFFSHPPPPLSLSLCPGREQIVSEMSVQLERFVDIDPRPTGDGVRCCPRRRQSLVLLHRGYCKLQTIFLPVFFGTERAQVDMPRV